MTDRPLQLPEGGLSDVEVELTNRYPRVDGRLRDPKTMTSNTRVLLFARDRARWRLPFNQHFAVAVPTRDGSFTAVLPPGDYYAAAVHAGSGMEWQDPEFLAELLEHSTTFSAAPLGTVLIVVR